MSVETPVVVYAMGLGGTIILGLIGAVWNMVRKEAESNAHALEKKASAEALKEAKEQFSGQIKSLQADYQQRLKEVQERQDREIDWIKAEMDKIARNLEEMRRENNSANSMILQRLQDLALSVGNHVRATS